MNGIKKHRGLKRYYKNLELQNDFKNINTSFDNFHIHFDWNGYGNNSFKKRKPHLDKLFRHFNLFEENNIQLKNDFHLCAVLLDYNSASDALFVHSSDNPNISEFTFKISDLKKTTTLTNNLLIEYINSLTGYEKLYGKANESFCLLYKKQE